MTKTAPEAVELTARQSRFVDEYLKDLNATQAAIRAGYSEKTARSQGQRLLTNVDVEKSIAERKAERSGRTQIDADYVLRRLVEIDQMDVLDIMNDEGGLRPIHEWPKAWRITLSGFDISSSNYGDGDDAVEHILKKIKWPDKVKNLELIGRHVSVQAWREHLEMTGKNGGPIQSVNFEAKDPQEAAQAYRDLMG